MTGLTILILAAVHVLIVLAAFVVLCLPQESTTAAISAKPQAPPHRFA